MQNNAYAETRLQPLTAEIHAQAGQPPDSLELSGAGQGTSPLSSSGETPGDPGATRFPAGIAAFAYHALARLALICESISIIVTVPCSCDSSNQGGRGSGFRAKIMRKFTM